MTHGDERHVLIAIGPSDQHMVIVTPPYRRDVVITSTTVSTYIDAGLRVYMYRVFQKNGYPVSFLG